MKITITISDREEHATRSFEDDKLAPDKAVDLASKFVYLLTEEIARQAEEHERSSRTIIIRAEADLISSGKNR